eukprot:1195659-Prorocentrum_minimum.AAC.1
MTAAITGLLQSGTYPCAYYIQTARGIHPRYITAAYPRALPLVPWSHFLGLTIARQRYPSAPPVQPFQLR